MLEWAYDGVNSSIPRNSGPECANYMSPKRRIIETFCVSIFIIFCLSWGYKRIKLPKPIPYINQDRVGKRILLIVMSLVLGMEIGFKLTSRTFIYFMNPCHIHTIAQVSGLIKFSLHIFLFQIFLCILNRSIYLKKNISTYRTIKFTIV